MVNKYKISELAKDLSVPTKEIVELLNKKSETPKTTRSSLEEKDLNIIFETYTEKFSVNNIDEFFTAIKKPSTKKVSDKKDKKEEKIIQQDKKVKNETVAKVNEEIAIPAKKPVAKEAPAKEIVEKEGTLKETTTGTPKPITPKVNAPQGGLQNAPQGDRPQGGLQDAPQGDRPQGGFQNAPQGDRPQGGFQNRPQGDRPQGGFQNRPQGDRPQGGFQNAPQGDRPQGGFQNRPQGDRPQGGFQNRPQGDRPQGGFQNAPQGDRPQGGFQNRPQGDRPQGGFQNRPQGGFQNAPQGDRPQGGYQNRPQGERPQGGYQNRPQGGYQNRPPQNKINNPKPLPAPRPAPNPNIKKIESTGAVHVDMRASHVDLEKYNEKYDAMGPINAAKNDNIVKKQKLNQRSAQRGKPKLSRKEQEASKLRKLELERNRRQKLEITIPVEIVVSDLALRLKVQTAEIIKKLMLNGIMASATEVIDYDTAALVAMEIGAKVSPEVIVTIEERLFEVEEDDDTNLMARPPVVVVMGHVDHGKTSLLDAIRNATVTTGEAGGITQHIGAYQVVVNNKPITFLDTPGHEAFTSMRARGASITDIAILVVAADDGIMPQTIEAINHAKAAGVSIIVAINKMDKPGANPEKVKQELTEYELVPEEWGGDVICVPVSAAKRENIDLLLEMVQLVADMGELKANPDKVAKGTVIEAKLDKGRGPIATVLVQSGTLKIGDTIIAGTAIGRVRVLNDEHGNKIEEAGPSKPVEITGLSEVPSAGDTFNVVENEKLARELVDKRKYEAKEEKFSAFHKVTLENLFDSISDGEMKELPVIVKADVQGSVEAVKQSLEKLTDSEVRVRVIHSGVGAVSESDVMLASASGAIVIGFNVRPEPIAQQNAERDGVELRLYRIIYDAINDVSAAMKGLLDPKTREVELGRCEVRNVFKITNVGLVAGCYVTDGKITRAANIRIVRDGIVLGDDKLDTLKRMKDEVKEVAKGFECGIRLTKFTDIKEGDFFEAYIIEEYRD